LRVARSARSATTTARPRSRQPAEGGGGEEAGGGTRNQPYGRAQFWCDSENLTFDRSRLLR
jgi:hypothetical protein